ILQRRSEPGVLYTIAIEDGSSEAGNCYARVERATSKDVVISCTSQSGRHLSNRKFVYDVRAKALVKQFSYDPFPMIDLFVSGKKANLIGADRVQRVVIEYDPGSEPPFRLLRDAQAQSWMNRVALTTPTFRSVTQLRHEMA